MKQQKIDFRTKPLVDEMRESDTEHLKRLRAAMEGTRDIDAYFRIRETFQIYRGNR
jgi:hypothetical protein